WTDERAVLAGFAIVAAVDDAFVRGTGVRRHRRQHARQSADRDLAIMRVEARRPHERTLGNVVRPDDVQLVAVRAVHRPHTHATTVDLEASHTITRERGAGAEGALEHPCA